MPPRLACGRRAGRASRYRGTRLGGDPAQLGLLILGKALGHRAMPVPLTPSVGAARGEQAVALAVAAMQAGTRRSDADGTWKLVGKEPMGMREV